MLTVGRVGDAGPSPAAASDADTRFFADAPPPSRSGAAGASPAAASSRGALSGCAAVEWLAAAPHDEGASPFLRGAGRRGLSGGLRRWFGSAAGIAVRVIAAGWDWALKWVGWGQVSQETVAYFFGSRKILKFEAAFNFHYAPC